MGLLSTIGAASGRAFGFTRSAIAQAVDAYFNLTTLLLPGNGTNGAQNNTFLDSSTNNFTITRNGNTTQGTFSPFSQTGWGVNFNRGYLSSTLTGQAAGTGSFTYELFFWVNIKDAAISNVAALFNTRGSGTGADGFDCQITTAGAVQIGTSGSTLFTSANSLVADNTWYHLAIVRNGTTNCTVYLNGSSIGTYTASTNYSSTNLYLGVFGGLNDWFKGYVSNFRYTRDAVYTAGFTVPTSPLTPITNTQFLTAQSNRYLDTSANAFAITPVVANGGTSVQAFSPFAPTAAYSAATVGGSGYFDGTGDYLTKSNINFSTNAFTIEGWFYLTSTANNINYWGSSNGGASNPKCLLYMNGSTLDFETGTIGGAVVSTAISNVKRNAWQHIVICRSGTGANQTAMFLDGQRVSTGAVGSLSASTGTFNVGYMGESFGTLFTGYIASFRVVNGTDVYGAGNTTITIPTAPVTDVTNTNILLNFTNAGITDATAKNDLETVGNAQISTTQSKFGGSSMYFDGNGDYLFSPQSNNPPNLNVELVRGDFTIEFWFRANTVAPTIQGLIVKFDGDANSRSEIQYMINLGGSSLNCNAYQGVANNDITFTSAISANTWYHVAFVRSGTSVYAYLDGTRNATIRTITGDLNSGTNWPLYIGTYVEGGTGYQFNGFIDDLRITKFARYSGATITVPTAAFPVQ